MPHLGIEPTIPVFERMKTVYALDRAATVAVVMMSVPKIVICYSYAVNKMGKYV
jgi:hypothetical protein